MNIIAAALNTRHTHSALALAYLKAYWEKEPGRTPLNIREYDLNQTNESIIADLIRQHPEILAFSVYIWSLNRSIDIAGAIKAAYPETIIIFGGPEVSYNADWLMNRHSCIDYTVRGEGEATFAELLHVLEIKAPKSAIEKVKGISWRDGATITNNPDRELITDLDCIPSPFQAGFYKRKHSFTYYEASRGCPSRCSYCLSSVLGRLRHFSVERVEADLDWFFNSDYRQVRFADRTFNHDIDRAKRIIKYVKANNHRNINVHFEIQADFLSEDIIDLMADAPEGMFHLEIGIQSTNPSALKAVNRRFDLSILKKRVKQLKERTKCHLHLDLLGALPMDRITDFFKSLDDVWQLAPHSIQISLVKVLRGTLLQRHECSDEISAMPTPPYTVLRTKWLTADEAVLIQDIGKLVEGIYNCARYPRSLDFIVTQFYQGSASSFFSHLAGYWRAKSLPFYNFSPENIARYLKNFIKAEWPDLATTEMLPSLIEHEQRLTQKVPVNSNPEATPQFENCVRKTELRVQPGYRVLWYQFNPLLLAQQELARTREISPIPILYRFEKDLSATPDVEVIELSMPETFVMAAVQAKSECQGWLASWQSIWPQLPPPNFTSALEKLLASGLLYKEANAHKSHRQS